jgi:multiple RNA-binding domain-containing protein 1
VLDGHALILQLCHVKNDGKVQKKVEKDKSSTKLHVKNVAFEATKKDLRQLFSPFGQVIIKNDNFSTIASKYSLSQPKYEHLAVYYKYLIVFLSLMFDDLKTVQIKSLRLPMKFGNHRGFAFVKYVTQQEAQNALTALSSTHLYGRHLVSESQ